MFLQKPRVWPSSWLQKWQSVTALLPPSWPELLGQVTAINTENLMCETATLIHKKTQGPWYKHAKVVLK